MRTRLVNMGNSRGVRLPKPLIEQVGLGLAVDLSVRDGAIVIAPVRTRRAGWAAAAAEASATALPLDPVVLTNFDNTEWHW